MNITVTDQENCKKQLRIEIPGEIVREETEKVATNLARQVNIPGFRRGHVPKSVVKTRFRKELRDEVLSHLLPHMLGDAIREKDLKVIGEPAIEDMKFGDDESIDVTFAIEVKPDINLSNYKELPLKKQVYKIRDEDVEQTVERLRQQQAELVPVEDRGARAGDIVTATLTGRPEPAAVKAEEIPMPSILKEQSQFPEHAKYKEYNFEEAQSKPAIEPITEETIWDIPIKIVEEPIIEVVEIVGEEMILHAEAVEIITELAKNEQDDDKLKIELLNETVFRGGERKTISLMVRRGNGEIGLSGAHILVKIIGSAFRPLIFHAKTDSNGVAIVHLQLPHLKSGRAAILIRAMSEGEETELRRIIHQG